MSGSQDMVLCRWLGRQSYEPVWRQMQAFTEARDDHTADELWLLEHDPVYTLGMNATQAHVLAPGTIPVVPIDRGGQVTYHGPGQLMLYALIDLRRRGLGVRALVQSLEQAVIDYAFDHGIVAGRRHGAPGVYVEPRKLASVGLRVRRGGSYHGLALNVCADLAPFRGINPCGYAGLEMVNLADLGAPADVQAVGEGVANRMLLQLCGDRSAA